MASAEEESLLAAVRRGDSQALETLLGQVQGRVYRFSMKMCRHPEDAQDVLQETLLAAARTAPGFRGASSVSTWLYTIARSFCIKKRRRRAGARPVPLEGEVARAVAGMPDPGPGPERSAQERELLSSLDAAIAALDAGQREVLLLRDVEGLSAAEVARITGLSVAAVKSRLHRARGSVRERLLPLLAPETEALPVSELCPDAVLLLSRHLEGEIGPAECARLEEHVAACDRCRAACASLRESLRLCRSLPPPAVPEPLQAAIRRDIRQLLSQEA